MCRWPAGILRISDYFVDVAIEGSNQGLVLDLHNEVASQQVAAKSFEIRSGDFPIRYRTPVARMIKANLGDGSRIKEKWVAQIRSSEPRHLHRWIIGGRC